MTRPLLKKLDEGKLYYSISEVCQMTGLEPHVLRYWETEFRQIKPKKNRAGNRAYRNKEIKYIRYLRYLLHEEKFTLQGAKKKISEASLDDVEGQLSLLPPVLVPPTTAPVSTPTQLDLVSPPVEFQSALQAMQQQLAQEKSKAEKLRELLKKTRDDLTDLKNRLSASVSLMNVTEASDAPHWNSVTSDPNP
jgi:DNA-binding transcriptional MerR regulator